MTFFREPVYLKADGTEGTWPRYETENKRYLRFDINMSEENEDSFYLTENKRLFTDILPNLGGGVSDNSQLKQFLHQFAKIH